MPEAGKLKIKAPADLVSGGDQRPGSQMAVFLWYLHIVKGRRYSGVSYKGTHPIHEGSTLMI